MAGSLKRLQETTFLNNQKRVLQERQSLLEAIFMTMEGQLKTSETLRKPNYESQVLEKVDCFETVMTDKLSFLFFRII